MKISKRLFALAFCVLCGLSLTVLALTGLAQSGGTLRGKVALISRAE